MDSSSTPTGIHGLRARTLLACALLLGLAACSGGGGGAGDPLGGDGSGTGGELPDPPEVPGPGEGSSPDTWLIGPENDFDPLALQETFTLSNPGPAPLEWNVQLTAPWLQLTGAGSGTLASGASVTVTVDADPYGADATGNDLPGAQVVFRNTATSAVLQAHNVVISPNFSIDASFAAGGNEGWTALSPSPDTKMVYVSNSTGNDANDGLSPATAKKTIAAGKALLAHGHPDWLLLRRGDTWNEQLGQWNKSGRSPSEPMVVAWYGSAIARPLLQTGTGTGLWVTGAGGLTSLENVAIIGLHFKAHTYTGSGNSEGAQILLPTKHLLLEDCMFEGYNTNLVLQGFNGRHEDLRVRRCVIIDAYGVHGVSGHPQGLYALQVDGLLIEENLFDHNGWSTTVPNAGADIFSHNIYIDNDCTGVVVRGNIISRASSHGMQLRPGGIAINNLFVQNSIALGVGGGNDPDPGGVLGNVLGNVILEGKNIDAANPRGWGLWFANIAEGRAAYNVVANNSQGTFPFAMIVAGDHDGDTYPSIGVHNLLVDHNIYRNWGGNLRIEGQPWQVTNLDLLALDVQDLTHSTPLMEHTPAGNVASVQSGFHRFYSQLMPAWGWSKIAGTNQTIDFWKGQVGDTTSDDVPVVYANPDASVGSYNAALGGAASLAAFLAEARKQSYVNWRPEYMAVRVNRYVRDSFRSN